MTAQHCASPAIVLTGKLRRNPGKNLIGGLLGFFVVAMAVVRLGLRWVKPSPG